MWSANNKKTEKFIENSRLLMSRVSDCLLFFFYGGIKYCRCVNRWLFSYLLLSIVPKIFWHCLFTHFFFCYLAFFLFAYFCMELYSVFAAYQIANHNWHVKNGNFTLPPIALITIIFLYFLRNISTFIVQ